MGDLLPCPFCGTRYRGSSFVWKGTESRFECNGCGALGPFPENPLNRLSGNYTDAEAKKRDIKAVEAWNRRI